MHMYKSVGDSSIELLDEYAKGRKICLYGASGSCKKFLKRYHNKNYNITYLVDSSEKKWGKEFEGYVVNSPELLEGLDKENVVIVITSVAVNIIEDILKQKGFKYIFSSTIIRYREFYGDKILKPFKAFDKDEMAKLNVLKGYLADDKSKEVLEGLINIRNSQMTNEWYKFYSGKQYFCKDIFQFTEKEVFVDGGAYTGDTAIEFAELMSNKYKKIYSFEPDKKVFEEYTVKQNLENYIPINKGLWDTEDVAYFEMGQDGSSKISEKNNLTKVELDSIDRVIREEVTFIKMDIEGAEMKALKGASEHIKKYKPKLAICLYHKPEDIIEIPFYIKELVPEYKMYIRHHSLINTETVLYAKI